MRRHRKWLERVQRPQDSASRHETLCTRSQVASVNHCSLGKYLSHHMRRHRKCALHRAQRQTYKTQNTPKFGELEASLLTTTVANVPFRLFSFLTPQLLPTNSRRDKTLPSQRDDLEQTFLVQPLQLFNNLNKRSEQARNVETLLKSRGIFGPSSY